MPPRIHSMQLLDRWVRFQLTQIHSMQLLERWVRFQLTQLASGKTYVISTPRDFLDVFHECTVQ